MDIIIRDARPAELDEAGELTASVYLGDGLLDFGEDDPYLEHLRDARRRAEHAEVLVAVDPPPDSVWEVPPSANEVLGCVTFVGAGGEFADIAADDEAEFRMLAVRPSARGRGAGEALVLECLRRARRLGKRRVVLSSQSQMHTAHRLYERLGFVRAPERDWEPIPGMALHVFALDLSLNGEQEHNI
ncbi:GNAT family N-acetyltransferase [Streptomyces litchfieldiae]|uniref:GNAT family N-acetyltransferase n=1 Tax=Streptomyces litchfieldiae TaxID=3075543 RepID=A0ABU2MJ94_9ACTN|nr:GNAT family N-acetyltransferase [Streptomyces sp. DSM 44938]MDT0341675.1 GNAT family N-acetyltransferase [Streptomyces sp. DSM 44938]